MVKRIVIAFLFFSTFTSACRAGGQLPTMEQSPSAQTPTRETPPKPTQTFTFEPTPTQKPSYTPEPSPTLTSTATHTPTTLAIEFPWQPFISDEKFPDDILSIQGILPDGSLVLATEKQVIILKDDEWQVYLSEIQGELAGIDAAGRLWIIDQDGSKISSWDGTLWTTYLEEDGWVPLADYFRVRNRPVTDGSGHVWLVIDNELRVFNGESWDQVTTMDMGIIHPLEGTEDVLPDLTIAYLENLNEVWLGSCFWTGGGPIGGGGVLRLDGSSWQKIGDEISSGCTETIVEDGEGRVWFGLDGSLWNFDPQANNWLELEPPISPFESNSVFFGIPEIYIDPGNNPWAEFLLCGGGGCGFGPILYRYQDGEWVEIISDGLQYQRKMVFDNQGIPWLFTPGGIFNVSDNDLDHLAELYVDPHSIRKDGQGKAWFLVEENEYPLWVLPVESPAPESTVPLAEPSPGQCPPPGDSIPLTIDDLLAIDFEENIAAYLNARGSAEGLASALTGLKHGELNPEVEEAVKAEVASRDVTGSTTPDVLVSITIPYGNGYGETTLSVYVCQDGRFVPQVIYARRGAGSAAEGLYTGGGVKIATNVRDLNGNGVSDLIFSVNWPNYTEYYAGTWSGGQFESLIPKYLSEKLEWTNRLEIYPETDSLQIKDATGDNQADIVIARVRECSEYIGCLPRRMRTETWAWNGKALYPVWIAYSTPTYRFQAAVDGDNASRGGDFEAAIELYQMAIFDEDLRDDWPPENPIDHDFLAAYSRYRLLLLHAYRSYFEPAKTVYETLVEKFPEGTVGHEYAALAAVFWQDFEAAGDFDSACRGAKEFAIANRIGLNAPYSDGFYEIEEFLNYYPKDICSYEPQDY